MWVDVVFSLPSNIVRQLRVATNPGFPFQICLSALIFSTAETKSRTESLVSRLTLREYSCLYYSAEYI